MFRNNLKTVAECLMLLVFTSIPYTVQTGTQSHNVEWGAKSPNDRQLFRKTVEMEPCLLNIATKDVSFAATPPAIITYINVKDQYTDGNGGCATLVDGGIGYKNVTIHLKSQRFHGFNFTIEIYGQ